MQSEVVVYAVPFLEERPLTKGDVAAAIAWFKGKTGNDARLITLNPRNEKFAREAPDGVAVNYVGGCLAWEIWLLAETEELTIGGAAPMATEDTTGNAIENSLPTKRQGVQKVGQVNNDVPRNMSTLAAKKVEVDIFRPPVATGRPRRGPRAKALPLDLVTQWAAEGIGSKAIATRLKAERGIEVSYKTIQRVISGERPLFS